MKNKNDLTVKQLIKILKTMPQDAIVASDDGTGWLAKVRSCDIELEEYDDIKWVQICGNGEGV